MAEPRQSCLKAMLAQARAADYAVGTFSCRYPLMVRAVLETAMEERSPAALSVSQLELDWFETTPDLFIAEVGRVANRLGVDIPYAVHLDHSWDINVMQRAIACGFGSVMFDASARPLRENIAKTREVVETAHVDEIAVEAELGRAGAERGTLGDADLHTRGDEAARFVKETKCDILAVSVGTRHGVYPVKNPGIDFVLLAELSKAAPVPLALHGGEGLPAGTIRKAASTPGGGISKVNVGTELEMVMLEVLGMRERLTPAQLRALTAEDEERALPALKALVAVKMRECFNSSGKA